MHGERSVASYAALLIGATSGCATNWTLAATAASLLLVAGCAVNPVSGRPEAVLISEAKEIEQDRRGAEAVEKQMGLVENAKLSTYVDAIGQRLAQRSPRQSVGYRFHVVDMAVPNAFALPAGSIYVSRGLLSLVNSEDELANVIAHEIGHVAARHAARQQTRRAIFLPARIAGGIGGAATSILSPTLGRLVAGVAQLPGALTLATYSRGQESEADRIGQELAAELGWDPGGLASFMDTLAAEERLSGGDPERVSFLASHPTSPERSKKSIAFARGLERASASPIASSHTDFLGHIVGIVVGPSASEGVFVENRFLHPGMKLSLHFPDGWETANTPESVMARSPDKKRFVVFTVADEGNNPFAAALDFARRRSLRYEPRRLEIGGLPAAHSIGESGSGSEKLILHLTWISHAGSIYQVTGISAPSSFQGDTPAFDEASRSFHVLTSAERNEIRENRLRLTQARAGETLAALLKRVGSSWTPEEAAVANAIELDAVLSPGRQIKFARPEPLAD